MSSSSVSDTSSRRSSSASSSSESSPESIAASVDSAVREALRTHTNSSIAGSHTGWGILREALRTRTMSSNPGSQHTWSALRDALLSHPSSSNAMTAEVPRRLADSPNPSSASPTRSSSLSSSSSSSDTLSLNESEEDRHSRPDAQQSGSTATEGGTPASSSDVSWVPLSGRRPHQEDSTPTAESPARTASPGHRVTFPDAPDHPSGDTAMPAQGTTVATTPRKAASFTTVSRSSDRASLPLRKQFSVPPRRDASHKSSPKAPSSRAVQSPVAAQHTASGAGKRDASKTSDAHSGGGSIAVLDAPFVDERDEGEETVAVAMLGVESTTTVQCERTMAAASPACSANATDDIESRGADVAPPKCEEDTTPAEGCEENTPDDDSVDFIGSENTTTMHCQDPDVETVQPTTNNTEHSSVPTFTNQAPREHPQSSTSEVFSANVAPETAAQHGAAEPVPSSCFEYGCDDDTLKHLLASNQTLRKLHYEASRISKAARTLDATPILPKPGTSAARQRGKRPVQQPSKGTTRKLHSAQSTKPPPAVRQQSAPLGRKESFGLQLRSSPTSRDAPSASLNGDHSHAADMDLRYRANDSSYFAYDALHDEHCQEFLEHNKTFQSHWTSMKVHLQPNHRVTERVRDAMIPATTEGSRVDATPPTTVVTAAEDELLCGSRPGTASSGTKPPMDKMHVPAIRHCLCYDVDSGTSVDVTNAVTFFEKRRHQLRKGLPLVMQNPVEALLVQLQGPTGTMRASKGEPWPPDRQGPVTVPVVPRPPPPRSASILRRTASMRQGSFAMLGANRSFVMRPSTADRLSPTASTRSMTMSGRPFSHAVAPRLIPGAITPKRFNARSPFLDQRDEFTTFDAMFFPDGHAMREGTVAPSLYYFNKPTDKSAPRRGSTPETLAPRAPSMSILTETHINIIVRSEDYARRQIVKREIARSTVLFSDFVVRTTFYLERHRLRIHISEQEVAQRNDVALEAQAGWTKLLQLSVRDRGLARRNEEVFPLCPLLVRGDSFTVHCASEQSILVDLRWSGGDAESASLAIMVFDAYDRYTMTVLAGESLRCPVSGRPILRSWGPFRFRAVEESGAVPSTYGGASAVGGPRLPSAGAMPIASPVGSMEHRNTFELLLHNLSPQALMNRFVFVVMHPKKTGALLTPIRRAYLTVRVPVIRTEHSMSTSSGTPTPTSALRLGKVQTDTLTTELVSMRLADHPSVACYTVGSLRRQWFAKEDDDADEVFPRALSLQISSEELGAGSRPTSGGRPSSGRSPRRCAGALTTSPRRNMVSPFQRSLNAPPPLDERQVPPRAVSPIMDAPMPRSLGGSPPESGLYSPLWTLYCHDHSDPAVPNVHRLPGVLESALFMNEDDIWWSYVQAVVKLERMSDEFYEKIMRSDIELDEGSRRTTLQQKMVAEHEAVVASTTINPLKAAMMRAKDRAARVAPTPQPPANARRASATWAGSLQTVRAHIHSKHTADKGSSRPQQR